MRTQHRQVALRKPTLAFKAHVRMAARITLTYTLLFAGGSPASALASTTIVQTTTQQFGLATLQPQPKVRLRPTTPSTLRAHPTA